jgi:hypothetical protein
LVSTVVGRSDAPPSRRPRQAGFIAWSLTLALIFVEIAVFGGSAFAYERLISIFTRADSSVYQGQAADRNYAVLEGNGKYAIFSHFENKAGLMMCSSIGWKRVVNTSHDIKKHMCFIGTDSCAFFDIFPAYIRSKAPFIDTNVTRERFIRKQSKPKSKWLIADFTASLLLL